ncbi:MAG: hypothetical protein ABJB03_01735 [Rhodoglobus sp.]
MRLVLRVVTTVAVALVAGTGLAGCTPSPGPAGAPGLQTHESLKDAAETVAACMEDRGWTVTVSDDGGVSGQAPNGQESAYEKDSEACWALINIRSFDQFTDAEKKELFSLQLNSYKCLAGLGVDLKPAPTFQVYLDEGGEWSAYAAMAPDYLGANFEKISKACPQVTYF